MNKTERLMVGALFVLLMGWMWYSSKTAREAAEVAALEEASRPPVAAQTASGGTNAVVAPAALAVPTTPTSVSPAAPIATPVVPSAPVVNHAAEESFYTLANDAAVFTFSTWGGAISSVELLSYPLSAEDRESRVVLDFDRERGLARTGLPGLGVDGDFKLVSDNATSLLFQATSPNGLSLSRRIALVDNFQVEVVDTVTNAGSNLVQLADSGLSLGTMRMVSDDPMSSRYGYLSIDSLASKEKSRVYSWGKKAMPAMFGTSGGCSKGPAAAMLPAEVEQRSDDAQEWVAARSKHFVQVATPAEGCAALVVKARRDTTSPAQFVMESISADLLLPTTELAPGATVEQATTYYAGPIKYSELHKMGGKQDGIMIRAWRFWGWWRMACIGLLWLLNALNAIFHNYGVAIILLTVFVKLLMMPLTAKSAKNMEKMKELQPEIEKLKQKHKSDPQKQQQATMMLYRQHGYNPLGGCLPMLVQMPIFIALFTVLRSAVELRLAPFIPFWISDLSSPEGLFADTISQIPMIGSFVGELNILPLLMTGCTLLQQKMQPTSADPAQKQMMYLMPVMMLFFFYRMPSGLVLYWTVSQVLTIVQLQIQTRKKAKAA